MASDVTPYVNSPIPLSGSTADLAAAVERELRRVGTTSQDIIDKTKNPIFDIVPNPDNTYNLGSASKAWKNLYVGANHAPVLDTVSGNIGYYARTAAEISAGVTPTYYVYVPGDVRRYGAVGDGTTNDRAALNTANSVGISLTFPPGYAFKISSNLTLSVPLTFGSSTMLSPDTGIVVTISSTITAPRTQIFTGAGTISLGTAKISEIPVVWWGDTGDLGASCNKAITAAGGLGVPITFEAKSYSPGTWSTIQINGNNVFLKGAGGPNGTTINMPLAASAFLINSNTATTRFYTRVEDLQVLAASSSTAIGMAFNNFQWLHLRNVVCKNFNINVQFVKVYYFQVDGECNFSGAQNTGAVNFDLELSNAGTIIKPVCNQSTATGLQLFSCNGVTVINPDCESNTGNALVFNGTADCTAVNPRLEGNGTAIRELGTTSNLVIIGPELATNTANYSLTNLTKVTVIDATNGVSAPNVSATAVAAAPAIQGIAIGGTTASTATAGANGAPPAQVAGYWIINVSGTLQKVPYYNT